MVSTQFSTNSPAESLSGLIERVTFFNEDNGFCVVKAKVKGHRDLVTVVGALPSVTPGEWINAEGHWIRDREYGMQFKATILTSTPPNTKEGIERYLGSGMVKGIGPVYAKKLVATFGADIFDVIEQASSRLETVEGIGPKRRRQIKEAWGEQKVIREIMVFLHSHGVSTSRAVRIYKTYGEAAVETVRSNPYLLARDIQGIGFKSADQIAQRLGIPFDSLHRAEAGLHHVLLTATGEGHCALPVEVLRESTIELLEVGESIVAEALDRAITTKELSLDAVGGQRLVFLPHLRRAEEGVAFHLNRLLLGQGSYPPIQIEKAIAWCQEKTGKTLAASQEIALRQALTSRVLVVTGGPGVGKTTLLNFVLRVLRAKQVKCLLCAPTGRAAKRLGEATGLKASTIHRLLESKPGTGGFARNESSPLKCDLLVVDECSMVDVPLMFQLVRAVPSSSSLLFVGDVDQLPSVGPGTVLRDMIESGQIPVVRLTEVFRQAARSRIIVNAHRVNQGIMPELQQAEGESDFYFIERDEPEAIVETVLELVHRRIPRRFQLDPVRDIQVLSPMNRASLGVRELNARLQETLNPQREDSPYVEKFGWRFRLTDKVMQIRNNYDKDVFNGDIGQITKIDREEQEVVVRFDDRNVKYEFGELDELVLAYAITIHKAQGSEFPVVIIPVATQQYLLLQRNLIYTGITRGKQLVVLVGQKRALGMAVRNNHTERRYSGLLARLREGRPHLMEG